MTEQKSSKYRFAWLIHLLVFVMAQVIFTFFDGAKVWMIFNLNDMGKKGVAYFDWLFGSFQVYDSEQLNFVTVVWIIALVLHGIETIIGKLTRKYNKAI